MTTTMPPEENPKRGDVVLVLFPHADLRTAITRPALIVQANDLNTGLAQSMVAIITSRTFRANHPSRVTIVLNSPDGVQSGLLADSIVVTDNLANVRNLAIDRIIGKISMQKAE
jgi:mRNA interferase MazF